MGTIETPSTGRERAGDRPAPKRATRAASGLKAKRLLSSLLFQSTALAGTFAGLPLPLYSRAYAQALCSPSSTDAYINDGAKIAGTTFTCTISESSSVGTIYAYGGAYTFYQSLQDITITSSGKQHDYKRIVAAQPGLNISLTNAKSIDVGGVSPSNSIISTSTDEKYLYLMSGSPSGAISVVSRGGNNWNTDGYNLTGGGGAGGDVSVTSYANVYNTSGGGVYALSRAGDGIAVVYGGNGGSVTVHVTGDLTTGSFGVAAISQGGVSSDFDYSSKGYTQSQAGAGGDVAVTFYGSIKSTSGPAILAASYGGLTPRAKNSLAQHQAVLAVYSPLNQGAGGDAGAVTLTVGSDSDRLESAITANGFGDLNEGRVARPSGAALAATSIGGNGFALRHESKGVYRYSGGGNGGAVTVKVTSTSTAKLTTKDHDSPGVLAQSAGGKASSGADYSYVGGNGGAVSVTLSGGGAISVSGDRSSGIVAQSLGGEGQSNFIGTSYGKAGSGSTVAVTNDFSITTGGNYAHGIVAQSAAAVFGYGIYTYAGTGNLAWGDANAASVGSDTVTVDNAGAITTKGVDSHGIIAQSIGGGGGVLVSTNKLPIGTHGGVKATRRQTVGGSSDGADGNAVTVTNKGDITTTGGTSPSTASSEDVVLSGGIAILAQSIGGGGGTSGGLGAIGSIGGSESSGATGNAATGSHGGTVTITNQGNLTTSGAEAHGIVAQSIGGGGGTGRNGYGFFTSVGGKGGTGGTGGAITITNSGKIETAGHYASGIIAQSIGGGGGQGGATTSWGLGFSSSIGGAGGYGGDGGSVTLAKTSGGSITTEGYHAPAVLLQSIGGGGGTGGAAKSYTASLDLGISLATGGNAGQGGQGGTVAAHVGDTVTTKGSDSPGIVVQSIGGGGGRGGIASANALTLAVPVDPDLKSFALSISIAHGGKGGSGGAGGQASGYVESGTSVSTDGDMAAGMIVQSIGGGGGQGGDSTAAAGTFSIQSLVDSLSKGQADLSGKNVTLDVDVSLGGDAGSGGNGDTAYGHVLGSIATAGKFSEGLVVQSIGGGGGHGGSGESGSITTFGQSSFALGISLGGTGGDGGAGGKARGGLSATGSIATDGANASGLVVQSIGGGGGIGGGGSGSLDADTTLSIGLGASGGKGGDGGTVYAWNAGSITTTGDASPGIVAQSVGGGGGVGGSGTSSISHAIDIEKEITKEESEGIDIAGKAKLEIDAKQTATIGASGGSGGSGGTVFVGGAVKGAKNIKIGKIKTEGAFSHGILAQSIGGGGGSGSVSSNKSKLSPYATGVINDLSTLTFGGSGGAGGNGGTVTVYASDIATSGFNAHGVVAQSIGGGGGHGVATGYAVNTVDVSFGASASSDAAAGADAVTVNTVAKKTIATTGDNSNGVIAQSIGGGGGLAGVALGSKSDVNDDTIAAAINVKLGSDANSQKAYGSTVTVAHSGSISTSGPRSVGIVAQSISGGGGFLTASAWSISEVSFVQEQAPNGSFDVDVTLNNGAKIVTSGDGGFGVLAQSVAGGGGVAADLAQPLTAVYQSYNKQAASTDHYYAPGTTPADQVGDVTVTVSKGASISTSGRYAHGIVAQSISGSGGIYTRNGNTYAGTLANFNNTQNPNVTGNSRDGSVTVTVNGSVKVEDPTAWGVWAQTTGETLVVNVGKGGSIVGSTESSGGGAIYATMPVNAKMTFNNQGKVEGAVVRHRFDGEDSNLLHAPADGKVLRSIAPVAGRSLFVNQGTGTFVTGTIAELFTLFNAGTINVGGTGQRVTTVVTGDLVGVGTYDMGSSYDAGAFGMDTVFNDVSYYSGRDKKAWSTANASKGGLLQGFDVNMASGTSDRLDIEGDFAGTWGAILNPSSLLPNTRVDLLKVEGVDSSDFTVLPTLVFSFTEPTTSSSGWKGFQVDTANFSSTGVTLGRNADGVARGLQSAWDRLADGSAETVDFGRDRISIDQAFAAFHAATPETFEAMLTPLASQTSNAPLAGAPQSAIAAANSVLSCPAFTTGVLLQEGECVWGRFLGSRAEQDPTDGVTGFKESTTGLQTGGQKELGGGWFLGGSFAYEDSWYKNDAATEKLDAQSVTGALALKKEIGPWLFALAGGAGYTWGDSTRYLTLGSLSAVAEAEPKSAMLFGRARASYELMFDERFYMRPMVDFDVITVHQDGYTETGAGGLNLIVDDATKTVFGVTPGVEVGARVDLSEDLPARLFAGFGVSFLSDDEWASTARFAGVSSMTPFTTVMPINDTVGRVTAGIDLQKTVGMELKLQYDGAFADGYQSHGGSLRFGYRF